MKKYSADFISAMLKLIAEYAEIKSRRKKHLYGYTNILSQDSHLNKIITFSQKQKQTFTHSKSFGQIAEKATVI
jgi:hypothetical protein